VNIAQTMAATSSSDRSRYALGLFVTDNPGGAHHESAQEEKSLDKTGGVLRRLCLLPSCGFLLDGFRVFTSSRSRRIRRQS